MIVFFPIGHEENQVRRVPIVTIGIILICTLVLAFTQGTMERQNRQYESLVSRMQSLKATAFFQIQKKKGGDLISAMVDKDASNYYELSKKFGERINLFWEDFTKGKNVDKDDPVYLQYLELNQKLEEIKKKNIVWSYGMAPDRVSLLTLITSMFLHAGLAHLFFNMVFLFLFGMALEDVWGRFVFAGFYLISGFAASGMHIAMNIGSDVPCIGASGAIAGLMGAFLVRFYKSKIHFAYYYILLKVHFGKFAVPAFVMLPVWLGTQLLYATLQSGDAMAVAFWAHIGGFCFGVLGAFGLVSLGIGKASVREIDEEDLAKLKQIKPVDLAGGRKLVGEGKHEEGIAFFERILSENPNHLPAMYERFRALKTAGLKDEAKQAAADLINRYIASGNMPMVEKLLAQVDGEVDLDSQGSLKLAYHFEQNWKNQEAVDFYLKAAKNNSPHAGKALLSAARLLRKRLKSPDRAKELYQRIQADLPDDPSADIARSELKEI